MCSIGPIILELGGLTGVVRGIIWGLDFDYLPMKEAIKHATKITFLIILLVLILTPVIIWAMNPTEIDLNSVAAYVGASSGPLGVLTGAMAYNSAAKRKAEAQSNTNGGTS